MKKDKIKALEEMLSKGVLVDPLNFSDFHFKGTPLMYEAYLDLKKEQKIGHNSIYIMGLIHYLRGQDMHKEDVEAITNKILDRLDNLIKCNNLKE